MLIRHIVVDVLDRSNAIERAVKGILLEKCKSIFDNEELKLSTYLCGNGIVHTHRIAETLLLDLLDAENLLGEMLKVLPKQYLMIRLLERGMPVE